MAITGTGTQEDPYLVHSYTELKNPYPVAGSGTRYVKLANDIDCNDYGPTFEWETIGWYQNYAGNTTHLNLDGHTIKNVPIKNENALFNLSKYGNTGQHDRIENGKILNVFGNSIPYLIAGQGGDCAIQSLSISVNVTTLTQTSCLIKGLNLSNNALYIIFLHTQSRGVIETTGITMQDCDLHVELSDTNSTTRILYANGGGTASGIRITGKINSGVKTASDLIGNVGLLSSVIDIDASSFEGATGTTSIVPSSPTSAINIDNIPTNMRPSAGNAILCTASEIRNGDALRAKGFTVVNVSG